MNEKIIFGMFCMIIILVVIDIRVTRYHVCISLLSIALWQLCAPLLLTIEDNQHINRFTIAMLISLWIEILRRQGIIIRSIFLIMMRLTMAQFNIQLIWDMEKMQLIWDNVKDITLNDIISCVANMNIISEIRATVYGYPSVTMLYDEIQNAVYGYPNVTID